MGSDFLIYPVLGQYKVGTITKFFLGFSLVLYIMLKRYTFISTCFQSKGYCPTSKFCICTMLQLFTRHWTMQIGFRFINTFLNDLSEWSLLPALPQRAPISFIFSNHSCALISYISLCICNILSIHRPDINVRTSVLYSSTSKHWLYSKIPFNKHYIFR